MGVLIFCPVCVFSDPLGYPWSLTGEINSIHRSKYESFKRPNTDVYFEQGIDWFEMRRGWRFNTFIAGKLTIDTDSTRLGPWFGVQVKIDTPSFLPGGNRGQIIIGIRGEQDNYLYSRNDQHGELKGAIFLRWSFDGNHRK